MTPVEASAPPIGSNGRQHTDESRGEPALPAQDIDTERSLIGAMCLDAESLAIGLDRLTAGSFMAPAHRVVFRTLDAMREDGIEIGFHTLKDALTREGQFKAVGGEDFIVLLSDNVVSLPQTRFLCDIVERKHRLRKLAMAGRELQSSVDRPDADPDEIKAQHLAAIDGLDSRSGGSPVRPRYVSAAKLVQDNPILREPIIEGLLRRGEVMNVISNPKLKKSWLVLNLLLSVAAGQHWLAFPTRRSRCLLIDNELHPETLARRLPNVMEAMGLLPEDVGDALAIESLRGKPTDIYAMGPYFRAIGPGKFDIVVVDAWYRFQPREADENSNSAICAAYSQLDAYAKLLDSAFVVVHHASKGSQSDKRVTDIGAGAGSQARAADTHLVLREHTVHDHVVLEAAVRSWPPVAPVVLRWGFPLWYVEHELDPADLKQPPRRQKSDKTKDTPAAAPWTVDRFSAEVLTDKPSPTGWIVARAKQAGLQSERAVRRLLEEAEATGKVTRTQGTDRRVLYAK